MGALTMILGYVRVSSMEQAAPHKTSMQEQENIIMGYAMTQGVDRFGVQVFSDAGVSGAVKMTSRPGGSALLEAVQEGDTVIAAKMDRIFRSSLDALHTIEFLKAKGANLVLFDMGIQSVMRDGPSKLFFTMLAAFADFERGRINERITSGKMLKKKKGGHVGGCAPFGYRIDGRGPSAKLEINEEEQKLVEFIRERKQSPFFSHHKTLALINAKGFRTRTGKPFQYVQLQRIVDRIGVSQ